MHVYRFIFTLVVFSASFLQGYAQINTDQVMNVGRNALYFEDYVLSIQYFNQVIAAKPYLAQPYFYRGYAKFNLDDLKGAEEDVSQAIEQNPFLTDAYELRGVIRQNRGKADEALTDYDSALKMLPENRSLLFNKAMVLAELKRYDESLVTFDKLLKRYPRFENAYIGKARLMLVQSDSVEALKNVRKALELNRNSINAHLLEAEINMNGDYEKRAVALSHMDDAIKLNPKNPGFFINRAYLRHKQDDYFGAMSDYDYAIQLDPDNFVAHYNRAMLCTEVRDFDKALVDFNEVIRINPNEHRTLYNRAIVYREKQEYKKALADISKVIETFPNLAAAYFLRYDIKRSMGDRSGAQRDLDKSLALAKERIKIKGKEGASQTDDLFGTPNVDDNVHQDVSDDEAQETFAARFSSLLTVNNNVRTEQELNNKTIRGRIQDRNFVIETEPLITLTYFISPTELCPSSDYIKELDDVNRTRALRFLLQATCHEASLIDTTDINRHFESIAYYNSYLANHSPRAIDYFGRAMDYFTLRNYQLAAADFSRAIELTPNFVLAYYMRAVSQYRMQSQNMVLGEATDAKSTREIKFASLNKVLDDFDQVIKLSPNMPSAYYNKGTLLIEQGDLTSAIALLTKAIELKPDFGEAYYNRGYAYMKLGNRSAGVADLSKAGELGVVPSYNVLKRISVR